MRGFKVDSLGVVTALLKQGCVHSSGHRLEMLSEECVVRDTAFGPVGVDVGYSRQPDANAGIREQTVKTIAQIFVDYVSLKLARQHG